MIHLCPTCRQLLPSSPDLVISLETNSACARGKFVEVTPDQAVLAVALLGAWPNSISFEDIYDALWGKRRTGTPDDPNAIMRTQIHRLRKALEPLGYGIVPVWHEGYRLVDQEMRQVAAE